MTLQTLWTPDSANPRPCWRCESCGSEFAIENRDTFRRHAIKCSSANEEVIAQEHWDHIKGSTYTNDDTKEEYLEKRQKALREGVVGKGLCDPSGRPV